MKLSLATLATLKHFATISQSILVKPGNIISTKTSNDNIIAAATVDDKFEHEFAIYNLIEFLNVMSVFKDPEIVFKAGERQVTIVDGRTSVKYTFAQPALIPQAPKSLDPDGRVPVLAEFELLDTELQKLQKTMNILALPDVVFEAEGTKLTMSGRDLKNSSAASYAVEIAELMEEQTFKATVLFDNLRLLPGSYKVIITNRFIKFIHLEKQITTWISLERNSSKFN